MVDVLKRGTAAELREELLDLVTRDLLGPKGGPEEELEGRTSPSRWYLVGFLAPANHLLGKVRQATLETRIFLGSLRAAPILDEAISLKLKKSVPAMIEKPAS